MEPSAELVRELETHQVTLYLKGANGRYMGITPAGSRMTGFGVEELIGRTDFELFDKQAARRIVQGDMEAVNGSGLVSYFHTVVMPSLREVNYYSIKRAMRNGQGEHRALLALVFDSNRDLKQTRSLVRFCNTLMRYRVEDLERLAVSMVLYNNLKKIAKAAIVGA
jgi:hypothetical protein